MDKYDIVLNVSGSHVEDGEESTMEFFTEGSLMHDDDTYIIEYDESEISGLGSMKTRVTVDGSQVLLNRVGGLATEFIFRDKRAFEAAYDTPFGYMQMSVLPTHIKSDVTSEEGNIDIEYVVRVGEQRAFNKLNIHYNRKKN